MIIECDTVDQGCNGGDMDTAFDWIMGKLFDPCSKFYCF